MSEDHLPQQCFHLSCTPGFDQGVLVQARPGRDDCPTVLRLVRHPFELWQIERLYPLQAPTREHLELRSE
jgi:hypothetical protein